MNKLELLENYENQLKTLKNNRDGILQFFSIAYEVRPSNKEEFQRLQQTLRDTENELFAKIAELQVKIYDESCGNCIHSYLDVSDETIIFPFRCELTKHEIKKLDKETCTKLIKAV